MKFLSLTELPIALDSWKQALGVDEGTTFELPNPALLVLDMQNDFLLESGQMRVWGGPAIIPHVKVLINAFRACSLPVFFTRHLCIEPFRHKGYLSSMNGVHDPASFLSEGSMGAEIHSDLCPEDQDYIITKYRYSGFYDTPLDTLLKVNSIKSIIVAGVATNICCETTAHDAFFRGYRVAFCVDGTGATDENAHLASLRNIKLSYGDLVTVAQVVRQLTKANAIKKL